ncbi:uncharacterized protein J3D65DRAFT_281850 [Phyllosticta citribraziliensis]|uniref:Uncharacterized protein n=1 Tax=Phyllosticta citribraziliensis TaxID=989973 RepID=A0ABR1LWE0_9PEZI
MVMVMVPSCRQSGGAEGRTTNDERRTQWEMKTCGWCAAATVRALLRRLFHEPSPDLHLLCCRPILDSIAFHCAPVRNGPLLRPDLPALATCPNHYKSGGINGTKKQPRLVSLRPCTGPVLYVVPLKKRAARDGRNLGLSACAVPPHRLASVSSMNICPSVHLSIANPPLCHATLQTIAWLTTTRLSLGPPPLLDDGQYCSHSLPTPRPSPYADGKPLFVQPAVVDPMMDSIKRV